MHCQNQLHSVLKQQQLHTGNSAEIVGIFPESSCMCVEPEVILSMGTVHIVQCEMKSL